MKPNHILNGVRARLGMARVAASDPNPDDNFAPVNPPGPDLIDHICDFLSLRFDQHLDRWQVIAALALALCILVFSLFGIARSRLTGRVVVTAQAGDAKPSKARPAASSKPTGFVFVYVCGAVNNPGVYRAGAGTRVNIAVSLAGGLANNADATRVNLARRVVDGERIYIPRAGETVPPGFLDTSGGAPGVSGAAAGNGSGDPAPGTVAANDEGSDASGLDGSSGRSAAWRSDGRLNINQATAADLDQLPGIGPAFAARIIDYRQQHNGFTDVSQLSNVRGIGPKTLAKLKPLVCLE